MKRILSLAAAALLLLGALSGCSTKEAEAPKKVWTDGVISDGVYTNECLQMSFQMPDGWIEASEEETRTILNADDADHSTIYDVLLGSPTGVGKMFILCMDLTHSIGGSRLDEKELLQSIIDEFTADPEMDGFEKSEESITTVCGLGYSYCDVFTDGVIERVMMRKISDTELVMLGVVGENEKMLQHYIAHFTDDPESIPALPGTTSVEGNGSFSRGVISGGVYESEYLGLRFTPPEDWIYATDRELSELMGISLDMIGEDVFGDSKEIAKLFAKQSVIYDMLSASPNGSSVQIVLEDLSALIGGDTLTAAQYAEIMRMQLEAIEDYTYEVSEPYSKRHVGQTFYVVDASVQGADMQQEIWLLRVDKYMLCITFTAIGEENVKDYAEYITKI